MDLVCNPRKLLIVDDEPLVRQTLSFVLQDDYEVVAVSSGEEALEASARESFPVVVLDLCMSGLSGIETLQKLREIRKTQNVIILTAYESKETAIAALNLGAFNYITKPFDREHLKRVIYRGFEIYERRIEREKEMQQRLMGVHDRFFSLLCHEFNTPMNIILGFSELLKTDIENPDRLNWTQHITEAGNHLHDILMEIVDYTAAAHLAEAGVEREFVGRELFQPIQGIATAKGVTVEWDGSDALDRKFAGPADAIFMIVKKLLTIASHRSRDVRVSTSIEKSDGPNFTVRVGRTGIRADAVGLGEVERLFEPYQFTTQDASSCAMSLGLELATCRRIAEYAHATVEGRFDGSGELELYTSVPVRVVR